MELRIKKYIRVYKLKFFIENATSFTLTGTQKLTLFVRAQMGSIPWIYLLMWLKTSIRIYLTTFRIVYTLIKLLAISPFFVKMKD